MIVTLKTSLFRPSRDNQMPAEASGNASFILHEKGYRRYDAEGTGLLSIKSFYNGQAFYEVGRGRFAVDDHSYLILNQGQPYSITIDSARPMESFCIFFAGGFAEEVHRSHSANTARLVDAPETSAVPSISFFEKIYSHDDILSPALRHLRTSLAQRKDEPGWLQEQLHKIMQRLLRVHQQIYKEIEVLHAVRASTREELYRRLHRARDYAHAMFDQPITLDEMAQIACLSPNHFLRTFRQIFRQSPHQYLTALRLERAKKLLAGTALSVTEVCYAVGFASLGSFSWLFRRRFGISPEAYRQRKMQKATSQER
ncbi:MAG: helix-turn-helix domain-containing protein [bacterium]